MVGKDFGWIGNSNCESVCPTDCKENSWKYFIEGKNGGPGTFNYDRKLTVEGTDLLT